jgi:hypothetical protein
MIRPRFLFANLVLALFVVVFPWSAVFAGGTAKLTVAEADPPKEIAEPIRAALDAKVLRLFAGDEPFFEFWFRKDLPLAKEPENGTLDLTTIEEGAILGALKVDAQRNDFRNEEIPPGVYVVRYGIQPEDGNHLGVAPTRTFALLIPAKQDAKLDPIAHKDLMKAAQTVNAAKHPSNLNLQPVQDLSGDFPRVAELDDGQHKAIVLQLPAHVGNSGEKTTLTFALVYEGTGGS